MFQSDTEMFLYMQENLYVPVVCDMLDSLGFRQQAMHQRIRPLLPDIRHCGFVGRARTARWMETDYVVQEDPYGLELDFMDSLQPGQVVIQSTDYSGTNVPWGELMTTIAKRNGAVGAVCDCLVRDCVRIIEMNYPVYSAGIRPLDSMGRARMMAMDVPVRCGDVLVHAGDLIFADFDGVVVVPPSVEKEVLRLAVEKVHKENQSRQDLLAGKSLREVYRTYGVL